VKSTHHPSLLKKHGQHVPHFSFAGYAQLSKHKTALHQQTHAKADKYQQSKTYGLGPEKEKKNPKPRLGAVFTSPCLRRVLLRALPARPSL